METKMKNLALSSVELRYREQDFTVPYYDRAGTSWPIVYVHGLGCSKDDVLPMAQNEALAQYRLLSFDFPGCGGSPYPDGPALQIDDLVEFTWRFVSALQLSQFVIIGHSMGGLIALLLCEKHPSAVGGLINVEGNLAPEDCMFSRKVVSLDFATFEATLFPEPRLALASAQGAGFAVYLATLDGAAPKAFYDYAFQTVEYSDHGRLLERFLALEVPKLFVYGSENSQLGYLSRLRGSTCAVEEIETANHLPFHDNPRAFTDVLSAFLCSLPAPSS